MNIAPLVLDGSRKRYCTYTELVNLDTEKAFGIDIANKEQHLIGKVNFIADKLDK